jgi:hypothetical protein
MKRLFVLLATFLMIFSFAACGGTSSTPDGDGKGENLEGSLETILNKIYETAQVDDAFKDFIKNGLTTSPITSENIKYHLGLDELDYVEAIASEPMIQPGAYSLCLVRVKEGADIEKIKTDIKKNVDPRKWVCVGVDPNNVIVDNIGDVIFLVMSDDQAKPLHEAFLALGK